MERKDFMFTGSDGLSIAAAALFPPTEPEAIVQIAHGMAEHKERYMEFCTQLTDAGYGVYIHDHRGHGQTAGGAARLGFFADEDGWLKACTDMHILSGIIRQEQGQRPLFLFGHSMGSLLARSYAIRWGAELAGLILAGTGAGKPLLARVGKWIGKREVRKHGSHWRSDKLYELSFGSFNQAFKPNRTAFDWLSRDETEVDAYIADPRCGFKMCSSYYLDLVDGLLEVSKLANMRKMPSELPIFLVAGEQDPVGDMSVGVLKVRRKLLRAGMKDVAVRVFPAMRHEVLHEIDRDQPITAVLEWLDEKNGI